MKKLLATYLALAIAVWLVAPALTLANGTIGTELKKDSSGGNPPNVLVSWIARGDDVNDNANPVPYTNDTDYYRDDSTAQYTQIRPSGIKDLHTNIAMCTIVESEYGIPYIDGVYADVFYPEVQLGEHHVPLENQSGAGCGLFMQQDRLLKLTEQEGIDLFCNNVRFSNDNLPKWQPELESDGYNILCGSTGKLRKGEAAVYCGTKTISYEDPAGEYNVRIMAQDMNSGTGIQDHGFYYTEMTSYKVDFDKIDYGPVKLNINKIVSGDLDFGSEKATIRNEGNVRLKISVNQDDMQLGQTSGSWNVSYGARIGHEVGFTTYEPGDTRWINDELDLSEVNEMDFSVLVNKFPYPVPNKFIGTMILGAKKANFTSCSS